MDTAPFTWSAPEHAHEKKESDWFWSLGIVTVSISCVSFFFGNILFGVLILIAGATFGILAQKITPETDVRIDNDGITVGNMSYPYETFISFTIAQREYNTPILVLDTNTFLTPHVYIPLSDDVDEGELREYISKHIKEIEKDIPLSHRISEMLGL